MSKLIEIVDRGRGPQLSTSRITVQDLVPYFQEGATHAEIQEAMPTLSVEEIQVIERYVEKHHDAVMAQDQRIRERAAARRKPPEVAAAERKERRERLEQMRRLIHQRRERNGDQAAG